MTFRQIASSNSSLHSRETSLVFLVMELPSPEKKQHHQTPHHQCLHLSCTSCYTSAKAVWAKNPKKTKRPPNSHGFQSHISHRGSTARARERCCKAGSEKLSGRGDVSVGWEDWTCCVQLNSEEGVFDQGKNEDEGTQTSGRLVTPKQMYPRWSFRVSL